MELHDKYLYIALKQRDCFFPEHNVDSAALPKKLTLYQFLNVQRNIESDKNGVEQSASYRNMLVLLITVFTEETDI